MLAGNLLLYILALSVVLQLAAAVTALSLIRRSGFYLPWLLVSIAITLMAIRRITSFVGMIQRHSFPSSALGPELIALAISVLMLAGLWLVRPAFRSLMAARERELSAKDLLIRESHHHVKNDLQMLESLIRLQLGSARKAGERELLRGLVLRVHAFSVLHDQFYRGAEGPVSFQEYIGNLAQAIAKNSERGNVRLFLDLADAPMERRNLLYAGLLVNEALTNAYKYAFEEGSERAAISVTSRVDGDVLMVEVADNGKGIPREILDETHNSYGLKLMRGIGSYPGWSIEIDSRSSGPPAPDDPGPGSCGTRVVFRVPAGMPGAREGQR